MTKINWKPGTMLSPLPPVMVSCGTVDKPNVMTVAWTGIISSDPVMTYVSIRPQRYSHDIIKESGEFVINLPTWNMVTAVDFCGVKSGRDIDKFKEMNLTAAPCANVSAPQIEECPVSIACKVKSVTNYGVHDMFLAEVVGVSVDDKYINAKGALDLEKAGILAYAHGNYYTLGRNLGSFGFSVNKAKLKQMQKMEKVEVEVKKPKKTSDEKDTGKRFPVRRSPFGRRPLKKTTLFARLIKRKETTAGFATRTASRLTVTAETGATFAATARANAISVPDVGLFPGLVKSRADISRQTEKLFAKPERQTKSPGYSGDFV